MRDPTSAPLPPPESVGAEDSAPTCTLSDFSTPADGELVTFPDAVTPGTADPGRSPPPSEPGTRTPPVDVARVDEVATEQPRQTDGVELDSCVGGVVFASSSRPVVGSVPSTERPERVTEAGGSSRPVPLVTADFVEGVRTEDLDRLLREGGPEGAAVVQTVLEERERTLTGSELSSFVAGFFCTPVDQGDVASERALDEGPAVPDEEPSAVPTAVSLGRDWALRADVRTFDPAVSTGRAHYIWPSGFSRHVFERAPYDDELLLRDPTSHYSHGWRVCFLAFVRIPFCV